MSYYLGYEPTQGDAIIDVFTSDSNVGNDIYTLSQSPAFQNTLEVTVGGLMQTSDAFTLLASNGNRDIQIPGVAADTKIIIRQHGEKYSVGTVSNLSIDAAKIAPNAITTEKILDDAVTDDKILSISSSKVQGGFGGNYGVWNNLTEHVVAESNKAYFLDTYIQPNWAAGYVRGFSDDSGKLNQGIDESYSAHTIHWWDGGFMSGDAGIPATMIDTSFFKVGAKSFKFNGTDQYQQLAELGFNHPDWSWATTQPFTIEMWIRPNAYDDRHFFDMHGGPSLSCQTIGSDLAIRYTNANGDTTPVVVGAISVNEWVHVAISRNANGGTYMFIDGVKVAGINDTNSYAGGSNGIAIGTGGAPTYYSGYIDQIRISSISRYGGTISAATETDIDFTPPTELFKPDTYTWFLHQADDARR